MWSLPVTRCKDFSGVCLSLSCSLDFYLRRKRVENVELACHVELQMRLLGSWSRRSGASLVSLFVLQKVVRLPLHSSWSIKNWLEFVTNWRCKDFSGVCLSHFHVALIFIRVERELKMWNLPVTLSCGCGCLGLGWGGVVRLWWVYSCWGRRWFVYCCILPEKMKDFDSMTLVFLFYSVTPPWLHLLMIFIIMSAVHNYSNLIGPEECNQSLIALRNNTFCILEMRNTEQNLVLCFKLQCWRSLCIAIFFWSSFLRMSKKKKALQ